MGVEDNKTHLIFSAKDPGTFKSAAWRTEISPDIIFVSYHGDREIADNLLYNVDAARRAE